MNEDEFPRSKGKASGTIVGYSVEAKTLKGCIPIRINNSMWCVGEYLTDNKWTTLPFSESSVGVKRSKFNNNILKETGLLDYQAAQALRWWFLMDLESLVAIETRLVKHEIKYSWEKTAIKAVAYVDPEKREDKMADWNE